MEVRSDWRRLLIFLSIVSTLRHCYSPVILFLNTNFVVSLENSHIDTSPASISGTLFYCKAFMISGTTSYSNLVGKRLGISTYSMLLLWSNSQGKNTDVRIVYSPTKEMVSDYLTKLLQCSLFRTHQNSIVEILENELSRYQEEHIQMKEDLWNS